MTALKLDPASGDLDLTGGRLNLISGPDETAQKLRIRFRFFRGEYFADLRVGVPYFEAVFLKNPSLAAIQAIVRELVETCPGVEALLEFDYEFNRSTRVFSITVLKVQHVSGAVLDFTDDFILEVLR